MPSITARFYMADDGEVLSNKDYPVDKPTVIVPVLDPVPWDDGEPCPKMAHIHYRLYRAYTVKFDE